MGSEAAPSGCGSVRVRDVVRDVVAETAPEELPVVAGLAHLDDAAVLRRLERGGRGRPDPLGFGLGEITVLVAPVVWLVVDQAARQIGSAAAESTTAGLRSLLRRRFRRGSSAVTVPPLTPGQLAEVHRRISETAGRRGLAQERAESLADAVVARLALIAPEERTDTPAAPAAQREPADARRTLTAPAGDADQPQG
ncbi:hypothetical protein [Streptomyces sp. NPDC002386]